VRSSLSILTLLIAAGLLASPVAHAEQNAALAAVEADLKKAYPNVELVSPDALDEWRNAGKPLVVIDARTEAEFAVSHIEGARRVDPRLSPAGFRDTFGADLAGKTVVVYCAVGARSAKLADRIGPMAREAGASGVYNLEGGIFRWHNESRPLVGPSGKTDEVHPYATSSERLITRKEGIAYRPGTSSSAKAE
jgi:rhodanese-related sulfurtransferase